MSFPPAVNTPFAIAAVALALAAGVLAAALQSGTSRESRLQPARANSDADRLVRQAVAALKRDDHAAAAQSIAAALRNRPDHPEALLYHGQFAQERGDAEAALAGWRRVPDTAGRFAATARYLEAVVRLERQQARDAERLLHRAVTLNPRYVAPHERLVELYVTQMRSEAIRGELSAIAALRPLTLDELVLRVVADDRILDVEDGLAATRALAEADSHDSLSRIALARYLNESKPDEAAALLGDLVAKNPEDDAARAALLRCLLDRNDMNAAARLVDGRRPTEASPAAYWNAWGQYCDASGDESAAGRAYVESLRRQPHDGRTRYRLGQLLERQKRPDEARVQLELAKQLDDLNAEAYRVSRGDRGRPDLLLPVLTNVAGLLLQLDRRDESAAWYRHALTLDPQNAAAQQGYAASRQPAESPSHETLPVMVAEDATDVPEARETRPARSDGTSERTMLLVDRHDEAGIDFTYFNGATGRKYLVETVGGGVAVLDYDLDGWPDLYFCQGSDLPHAEGNREHADRLYRNCGDGTFRDVTAEAGIAEHGYSLGCTAADIDADGDVDLYVTNHGRGTFLSNNGDGTFDDATARAGLGGERMASSSAFADFDADGDLDLYIATYVDSLRVCRTADGAYSTCDPHNHAGPPDVLFRNNGDGTFADVSVESGVAAATDGKGLGVLAADFDEDGRPDLYVANDTTPNFLFLNRSASGGPIRFEERGLASGTALNGNGEAEAGMGIACADFDADGRLDLHVTNFYLESNTLYLNRGDGLFDDATRAAGLTVPTLPWLGFGTQAVDVDLDGTPDLFVANGHIDDYQTRGEPWKMPAQLFRNTGGARFEEVSESAGPHFSERCLGRGVARLDWNRDGKPDLAVVHQDRPAALLTNETPDAGRSISVRLVGVRSNRDAIGARLKVTAGGVTRVSEVCGGDGLMCSNERLQIVGVGDAEVVDRLEILWPSGESTVREHLPAGGVFLAVEGRPVVLSSPRDKEVHAL